MVDTGDDIFAADKLRVSSKWHQEMCFSGSGPNGFIRVNIDFHLAQLKSDIAINRHCLIIRIQCYSFWAFDK